MGEKLLLVLLIVGVVLMSTFLVAALVANQNISENSSQKTSLRLLDSEENSRLESEKEVEDNERDVTIASDVLQKASAIALEYIGEGKVTDTELGDEEGYYEIEITLDNGKEVDVHLNEDFEVMSTEYD